MENRKLEHWSLSLNIKLAVFPKRKAKKCKAENYK